MRQTFDPAQFNALTRLMARPDPAEERRRIQREMVVMMKQTLTWIGLMVSLIGFVAVSSARADEWDKKTILTFSQPVEIPGHVLPAGTYMFKLADTLGDRHIVEVFNADGSQIIATVMTIPDYRLKATDATVIRFSEVPAGSPEAIRAWFYPGNTIGQEFVYPKSRAVLLAKASKAVVPAIAVDLAGADELKTADIIAVTPDATETPVAAAIQTTPSAAIPTTSAAAIPTTPLASRDSSAVDTSRGRTDMSASRQGRHLPSTASLLPLMVFVGLGSLVMAFGLMFFGRPVTPATAKV